MMLSVVSGQFSPEGNCPPFRVGVCIKVRVSSSVLGLGGNQTAAPEKNCPPVKLRVWVRVGFGVGGATFLGAIVLEPLSVYQGVF